MSSGLLPSEARNGLAEAPPVEPPEEAHVEAPSASQPPAPALSEAVVEATAPTPSAPAQIDDAEERRKIDAELASLDAERSPHVRLADLKASADPALEALEARLGDIDL